MKFQNVSYYTRNTYAEGIYKCSFAYFRRCAFELCRGNESRGILSFLLSPSRRVASGEDCRVKEQLAFSSISGNNVVGRVVRYASKERKLFARLLGE